MSKKIFLSFLIISLMSVFSYSQDSYDKMAYELANYGEGLKKIAVIPFSYADNTSSTKDGSVISERLTMKLINMQKFEIIERSVLNKVLDELKLQNSGAIDSTSAKELGKVLGVDAIITGTLIPTNDGKIEVNARLIKTETAQAVGASQVYVVKDWLGGDVSQSKTVYQQNATTYNNKVSKPYVRGEHEYGFFDVMVGAGSQTMDIKWDVNKYGGAEMNGLTATGGGPIGLRIGGFGKNIVGGDFELSVSKHYSDAQRVYVSGVPLNLSSGFIDATSIGLSGDLLFRTLTKANLYAGLGLGLSINNIKSNTITDVYNKLLNETSVGIMFRVPIGIRFNVDNLTFFMEYRAEINSTTFSRNVSGESDTLTFNGSRFVLGLGSKF